jgi:hypothetical protein
MAFHLEGPWLSTTGKKKGPHKWASAEAKAKSEKLDADWQALQKKWGVNAEDQRRNRAMTALPLSSKYSLKIPPGRNTTAHIKSVNTGGAATVKAPNIYTGTKVKGIATMHKSNAVPVFSNEEAVEISKMRR